MRCIIKIIYLTLCLFFWLDAAQANIKVIDASGATVEIASPAKRIISLAPNLTEILSDIGAQPQIIARDKNSDFPPSIKNIPALADYYKMNIEHILSLKPNLIVLEQSSFLKKDLYKLRQLGIAVYVNKTSDLESVSKTMLDLGILSGHANSAQEKVRKFEEGIEALTWQASQRKKVSVFYELWDKPLLTVNNRVIIGEIISQCGGENIFGSLFSQNPTVSIEAVIKRRPKFIIISSPKYKAAWSQLKETKLVYVPADLLQRTGPRLLQGMKQVCRSLDVTK